MFRQRPTVYGHAPSAARDAFSHAPLQDGGDNIADADGDAVTEAVQLGVTSENLAAFLPFEITTTAYRRRDTCLASGVTHSCVVFLPAKLSWLVAGAS